VTLSDLNTIAMSYFKPSELEIGELWSTTSSGKELFHGHLLRIRKA
jgi:hypothetical protein